ncbi:long-chain-fatty-acid--CoA ligase [Planobispora rosea]|uniref:Long-chain-fatty-acid--CoA ligase n=1 Tax=Planobispora rosea TaxID=35762 RepID=A0A8J3WDA1_PLARO|nr:AMP-binding protein [Planobispora rosea]GGS59452.1 long-chain-fatty-acid--CoA ligase [Planobispora rosea]GIH84617.1 long-chain-fatty-acid--CoA ligase [Planobispora rosea]
MLVHSLLDGAAAAAPDAVAVSDAAGRWTYAELDACSRAAAAWLAGNGIGRGDRVLLQVPSIRETVALLFGASRLGAIFVPINPQMKDFHLRSVVENAEPAMVITVADRVPVVEEWAGVPVHALDEVWAEVERGEAAPYREGVVEPDDVAVLIYTSGSTAAPKAVICPHAQATFATKAIVDMLGYRPDDVVFCRFPLSWDYGLYKVLMSCAARAQIVLADRESDLVLLSAMADSGATVLPIVPSLATMILKLAERRTAPMPPLRLITNTGAALPQATIDSLREVFPGVVVVRQFGQTECKRVTVMPPELADERPGAVGLPLPGTSVRITGPGGEALPTGEVGEIVVYGPHVMPGYWRNPEATAQSFRTDPATGEPVLHTGDYGWLDEDGFLYFQGRRDDMFKRRGIRMSTLEIEKAAMDVPGVRAATVLPPTADRDLAVVVESELEPHAVLKELARRLESAKVPALCRSVSEIPLTLHGKNERAGLAALFEGSLR